MDEVVEAAKDRTGTVLSVRFSAEELDQLRREAERAGVPLSAFVRRFALERQGVRGVVTTAPPPNMSSHPDALTGIEVVGYSGGYTTHAGRNA